MPRRLFAGLLALTLATTATARPAAAEEGGDGLPGWVVPALVIGGIALAERERRPDDRAVPVDGNRDRADWRRDAHPREIGPRGNWREESWRDRDRRDGPRGPDLRSEPWLLPLSCLRQHFTRQGEVRLFEVGCLEARYRFAHQLPLDCATTIRSRGRLETGFDARCLRHEGFRVSDRR